MLGLKSLSPVLALPAAMAMSIGIVSIAAWLAWLTGTGMTGAAVLTLLAAAGAVGARIAWRKHAAPVKRPGRFELGAAALAAVAVGLVLYSGPWLGQSADSFYHMATAWALLRENRAIPQDVFFGVMMPYPDATSGTLHLVLAWVSLAGGMVPAWVAFSIFGAALTMLSFASLAREVTRSAPAALIATLLFMLIGLSLDMRDEGYPDRIGQALAFLSLIFLLRFARSNPRQWRELVPMCVLGFTAASVYPGVAPLLEIIPMATLGMAAAAALRGRNLRSVSPLAIACVALMVVVLPVLAVRLLAALPTPGLEASLATTAPRLRVIVFHGYPFIDLRSFWFGGFTSVTAVATACLFGRARRQLLDGDPGAALLWGGLLFAPAVAITPLVTGSSNEIYALARIAFLLNPLVYLSIGWELSALRGLFTTVRARLVSPKVALSLVAGLLLVAASTHLIIVGLHAGPQPLYTGHGALSITVTRKNDLSKLWADRLRTLEAAGPGTILAGLETSYELAGLTGRRIVSVPGGHTPYQDNARDGALRRGDVADALNPSADPTALLSVLVRYQVTFVMVDRARDGKATWDWIAGQKELTTVAQGSGWKLYRFDPARLDQTLEIPLTEGAGVFPSRVIAGRAVFVRFTSPAQSGPAHVTAVGLTSGATYQSEFALPDQAGATFTVPLLLPDSARVDRYAVSVVVPGSAPILAGQVEVGHAYEAEYFAGVIVSLNRGHARLPGWDSVTDPAYNRGYAALALRAGSMADYPLAEAPGDYCLSLLVFDAGDGLAHTLDVGLGGNVISATWPGRFKGIRELEMAVHSGSASHQLTYWVPTGARLGAIVDRITLYPTASDGSCPTVAPT